ncbi:RidA family protein [Qipengyuania gelatinilytica]|uniref:RidA family protein n=1 Tax=Qipengyuania gelatinilytica TaxID=2867231 RepID=A0ABX8ZZA4_9SPHN|nr:RidA family protein [Qipengyuania gelatinilytica]QZD94341.1 RidA family protein [Qipengyuania gelatinilytica]
MRVHERLEELGVKLPKAAAPVASYQPVVVDGHIAYVSGQLPFVDGNLVTGKLGKDVSIERGHEAARACGLMILAQLEAAGLLERVAQFVKLGGFVASVPEFTDQPKVINGASDLMYEVFGDVGKHARSAVGVPVLPLDAAVEVDAIVALKA